MAITQVWSTRAGPEIAQHDTDPAANVRTVLPEIGGTQFMVVTFAPDAVMMAPGFNPAAAAEENLRLAPGLAERFEPDCPGMHTTDTVDYGIVLDGEIWLELDDGQAQCCRRNDVIIQNGTRHAWRYRSSSPATLAFVMIGARRRTAASAPPGRPGN
jgi:quercetin dioxygenase-like cupin family protein